MFLRIEYNKLTKSQQSLLGQPFVVNVRRAGRSSLDDLSRDLSALSLAHRSDQELLADEQQKHSNTGQENVQEERFTIQTLIDLDDVDGLVENGFGELEARHVAVIQSDVQTERTTGKRFRRNERVGNGCLLAGWHFPIVWNGGEVLDVIVEVHRVAERCLDAFNEEAIQSRVEESNEEINGLASGQFEWCSRCVKGFGE